MSAPRALFTTVPVEILKGSNRLAGKSFDTTSSYQSWTAMSPAALQLRVSNPPFGLHFIRANVPGVDILEYPTWGEYRAALAGGYDVVGISFFTWTVPAALEMAEMARRAGAAEVWGGNYGVTTPGVDTHFNRLFFGNCESAIHEALHGEPLAELEHPVILGKSKWAWWEENVGYLYTRRGCNAGCTFCPTPSFAPGKDTIRLPAIRRVLDAYQKADAGPIILFDETFLWSGEARQVIEEMARRDLRWVCLTRADCIVGRVAELKTLGLHSAVIGVESIRDPNLAFVRKKEDRALLREVIAELGAHGCLPTGTYMLGFPGDTEESVQEDVRELASWGFFLMQFTLLTPFPGTPLWEEIGDRVWDEDWRHYDTYHLVWEHPHLSPEQARGLLHHALSKVNRPSRYLRKISDYWVRHRAHRLRRRFADLGARAAAVPGKSGGA
jgi:radical SAM superfamily enzyme YgiQ (UPF0313 family)